MILFDSQAPRKITQSRDIRLTLAGIICLVFIMVTPLLSGCGGGGGGVAGGGGSVPVDGGGGNGGVGGAGVVAQGSISGFGSVIVGGTEFETSGATKVIINENTNAATADLKLGMVVDIEAHKFATILRTEAETITYHNNVRGPIESIALNCTSMVVMGQMVQVDADVRPTLLHDACDLSVGANVEISGLVVDPPINVIRATLIDAVGVADKLQVSGLISKVDSVKKTFAIGALLVDYGGASVSPAGASVNSGASVIVTGAALSANRLTASLIMVTKSGFDAKAGTEAEVEGFIVDLAGKTFTVNGKSVDASTAVIEPSGATLGDGLRVEAEGKLDPLGVIIAAKVSVKPDAPLRLESNVEGTAAATLTLLGQTINIVSSTQFEDESSVKIRGFKLVDIKLGDHLVVSCYRDQAGQLIATKIQRLDPVSKVAIEGPTPASLISRDQGRDRIQIQVAVFRTTT